MNILRVGSITAGGNIILVTTDSGATVYAVSGGKVVSGVAVGGVAKLKVKAGTWRVWAEKDGQQTSEVEVIVTDSYYKEMSFAIPLSSLAEGALVRLNESGSGVSFYLAKHNYESGLNGAGRSLLVRKDSAGTQAWRSSGNNAYDGSDIDIRLNGTYLQSLDPAVRSLIGTTTFYNTRGGSSSYLKTIITLSKAVFLISMTELGASSGKNNVEGSRLPTASLLQSRYIGTNAPWTWTRSPSNANQGQVNYVATSGSDGSLWASTWTLTMANHFRPCFTLPMNEAMVNPKPNADGSYTLMV